MMTAGELENSSFASGGQGSHARAGAVLYDVLVMVITVLGIQFTMSTSAAFARTADRCAAKDVVSVLLDAKKDEETNVGQLCLLLPAAFGVADLFPYSLSGDSLMVRLKRAGLIHGSINAKLDEPLTKGLLSVIIVKTLAWDKGTFLERLFISLFGSSKVCFRVALRERLVPHGDLEDIVTIRELAAIMVSITALAKDRPMLEANSHCVGIFAEAILRGIVNMEEVKRILRMSDTDPIKAVLAM